MALGRPKNFRQVIPDKCCSNCDFFDETSEVGFYARWVCKRDEKGKSTRYSLLNPNGHVCDGWRDPEYGVVTTITRYTYDAEGNPHEERFHPVC